MLKKALIGLGIVLALLIAIVVAIGSLTPDDTSVGQTLSLTVGTAPSRWAVTTRI
jgi:hypothetical protein